MLRSYIVGTFSHVNTVLLKFVVTEQVVAGSPKNIHCGTCANLRGQRHEASLRTDIIFEVFLYKLKKDSVLTKAPICFFFYILEMNDF